GCTSVVLGNQTGALRQWDLVSNRPVGQPLMLPDSMGVQTVALSPDGKILAAAGGTFPRGEVRLWDAATGRPVARPFSYLGSVLTLVFRPDGKVLLTGGLDRIARQWDVATGEPIGGPLMHQEEVLSLAHGPDGKRILTGGADRTARLWDARTGRPLGFPWRHPKKVGAVALSPDGRIVLTGGEDWAARLWRAPRPWPGEVSQLLRQVEVNCGMELG